MLWLEQRFFLRGGQYADPQRFGEIQFAARLGGAVFLDALGGHHAGDRQTEDRLRGVNGVAARQRDPRLLAGKAPALHHFASDFRRQGVDRPAEDGNRHNRFPAHSENIADGVGGGDAAKVERVIDNRHKEIGGADDRGAITEIVNGGIIAGFVADKQVWIDKLRLLAMQDSFQHFRGNFTTTTGSVAVLR